eukprot:g37051.t1
MLVLGVQGRDPEEWAANGESPGNLLRLPHWEFPVPGFYPVGGRMGNRIGMSYHFPDLPPLPLDHAWAGPTRTPRHRHAGPRYQTETAPHWAERPDQDTATLGQETEPRHRHAGPRDWAKTPPRWAERLGRETGPRDQTETP